MYVINGNIAFEGQQTSKDTYIIVQNMNSINLAVSKESQLFFVETPKRPSYTTYLEGNRGNN